MERGALEEILKCIYEKNEHASYSSIGMTPASTRREEINYEQLRSVRIFELFPLSDRRFCFRTRAVGPFEIAMVCFADKIIIVENSTYPAECVLQVTMVWFGYCKCGRVAVPVITTNVVVLSRT